MTRAQHGQEGWTDLSVSPDAAGKSRQAVYCLAHSTFGFCECLMRAGLEGGMRRLDQDQAGREYQ